MSEHLMTPKEAWEHLRISRTTFYKHVKAGKIPVRRIGKLIRVSKSDLEELRHKDAAMSPTP